MLAGAGITFALLIGLTVVFQFALAAGAHWGHLAMGGRFPGRLPPSMRIAALVQAALLVGLAWIVVSHAGLMHSQLVTDRPWTIWLVVAIIGLSLAMNLLTPSKWERIIWAPVALALFGSAMIVAWR